MNDSRNNLKKIKHSKLHLKICSFVIIKDLNVNKPFYFDVQWTVAGSIQEYVDLLERDLVPPTISCVVT